MCGIVGYIGPKKVVPVIIEGLRKLEYRGYDSAGIAVVHAAGKLEIPPRLRQVAQPGRGHPEISNGRNLWDRAYPLGDAWAAY